MNLSLFLFAATGAFHQSREGGAQGRGKRESARGAATARTRLGHGCAKQNPCDDGRWGVCGFVVFVVVWMLVWVLAAVCVSMRRRVPSARLFKRFSRFDCCMEDDTVTRVDSEIIVFTFHTRPCLSCFRMYSNAKNNQALRMRTTTTIPTRTRARPRRPSRRSGVAPNRRRARRRRRRRFRGSDPMYAI